MQLNSKFLRKYGIVLSYSCIFWSFYLGAFFQGWTAFSLLVLPLSQYLIFLWLHLLWILKKPYIFHQYRIDFNNMGNLNFSSQKFFFCALLEEILLISMGIESNYHPQLVQTYFILYPFLIVVIFIVSPFFSMHAMFSEASIHIGLGKEPATHITLTQSQKKACFSNFTILIAGISILWIGFSILGYFGIFTYSIEIPFAYDSLNVSYMLIILGIAAFLIPISFILSMHILMIKNTIQHVQMLPDYDAKIYLHMIRNYIVFPRFLMA